MRTSPMLRLIVMGVLLMALHVPLTMMCSVVGERSTRRNAVVAEVSGNWGGAQTIGGPVLTVPFRYPVTDAAGRVQVLTSHYSFLPESLEIDGSVDPSVRKRTLFEVIVYTGKLKVRGHFGKPTPLDVRPIEEILWNQAALNIGVTDPRGIARARDVIWNGQPQLLVPGVTQTGLFTTGMHAPVSGVSPDRNGPYEFEFDLEVRGTNELQFIPAGNETTVQLTSAWPHPSFVGLPPDPSRVDGAGFAATWRAPYFGRGFSPTWRTGDSAEMEQLSRQAYASRFGVTLIQPVDIYVQTERAIKYAVLFIVMTFVIAFLWEIAGGALVHPIQYMFVGFALCMFYLLLLSIAEHWGFDIAFGIATAVNVLLLSWYWTWVLGGRRRGALMGGALTVLYGYLYLLLRLEDYALLAGSLGLFAMLTLVMFLTRRVNWYELRLGPKTARQP